MGSAIVPDALATAEFACLALAAASALHLALKRPLRQDALAHPGLALVLALAAAAAAIAAVGAAIVSPLARHLLTASALAVMAALWLRARPGYGAGRRWPPGSMGLARSLDAIGDRRFYRDGFVRHGPVFKMTQFGRPAACVLGHDRARRLLTDHAGALAPAALPYNRLLARGQLRYMAAETHRQEAPLFRTAFAQMDLEGAEGAIRASLRRELADLSRRSRAVPGGVNARSAFERWIVAAHARVFFGLAPDDPRVERLASLVPLIRTTRAGGPIWRRRLRRGVDGMATIVREAASDLARDPQGVARGSALDHLLAARPASLDEPARTENLVLIYRLTIGDMTGLLDWIFAFAGEAPAWRDEVRAHGRTSGVVGLATPVDPATVAVQETLRMEQSEFLYRRTIAPIELDGRVVPAGWILRMCVNESHRDAAVFADPDRWDPSRFRDRRYSRAEYSPFGGHTHGCMGAHLVHFLGRLFVEELVLGYDWTVTRAGPPERGSRHRDHWRPNRDRRAVLVPRAPEVDRATAATASV